MRAFRLRSGLDRIIVNGYQLPLGIVPSENVIPAEGYSLDFNTGEDDEPDTYLFTVAVSHDRLPTLLEAAWKMLPREVIPVVEIGSRDAYRTVDVYLGVEPMAKRDFLTGWDSYETFLLEDGSIAAGANAEEPFVEVFVDQFKRVLLHVPVPMRDEVEALLESMKIEEVPLTWPEQPYTQGDEAADPVTVRPVLLIEDDFSPDIDELLLQLRRVWPLELNIDPNENVDAAGRELGLTLWHALVILSEADEEKDNGAYASVWATARSIAEMEQLIITALEAYPEWTFETVYTIDRVAFDERPDELADIAPRRDKSEVHFIAIDAWGSEGPADFE
jgi:hypothetical protein